MPALTIQLPGLPPVEHILREDAITIGRMKGNTISLDDVSISLSHAKITRIGADYFLKDLNSTNGTMLNGQSVSEARLRDGDHLKFGEVLAFFRLEPYSALQPASGVPSGSAPYPAAQTVSAPFGAPASLSRPAAGPAPALPAPAPAFLPARPPRPRRNPLLVLVPILGILCACAVVGYLAWNWKMITGDTPDQRSEPQGSQGDASPATAPSPNPAVPPAVEPPAAVPPENPLLAGWLADLKSSDVAERRRAAQSIGAIETGARQAVPNLREALRDADAEVRMWSAFALVNNQAHDRTAVPILLEALKHENTALRRAACISLALIPYQDPEKSAVAAALKPVAMRDADAAVRADALTALKVIAPNFSPEK